MIDLCAGLSLFLMGAGFGCRYGYWRRDPALLASHGEPEWAGRRLWLDVLGCLLAAALLLAVLLGWSP